MNNKMLDQLVADLEFAISIKRPHGGVGVTELCDYILERVSGKDVSVDYSGNIHVDLRGESCSRSLFTAHVDTVHKDDGGNDFVYIDNFMHAHSKNQPLGADDGAGVAILLTMIDADVAGYYVFFQGEERGGIGSSWLALNMPELIQQFDRAIAFDRKGTHSIITEQMCGRTCSDEFAYALSDALNGVDDSFMYVPDDTGLYTDTAEFSQTIPECTNVSVGYYSEHTPSERIDMDHFEALAVAVLKIDWDNLPTKRDPSVVESKYEMDPVGTFSYYSGNYYPTYNKGYKDEDAAYSAADCDLADLYNSDNLLLIDALSDAKTGLKADVLNLLAEYVMPEDPEMALRFLNRSALTEELIDECRQMLGCGYDDAHVYDHLFEAIYKE